MPKSDTWPGGTGLETMNGMDSAGSCDSVVSANSGFSDDSLEHLSAEEKACLMFLEETIESLDTEEDSGLSNDEPDQLPSSGNLAIKLADLSASMSKSKLNGSYVSKVPVKENVDVKLVQGYLVPTPFVVANGSPCPRPSPPPDKSLSSKPQFISKDNKPDHRHNQKPVSTPPPLEVKAATPPTTKPRDYSVRIVEPPLPRGPLSYEALVHLRRSASTKKTPLCPSVDHTIEVDKGPSLRNLPRSDRYHSEVSKPKTVPPAVAPKPKKIPAHIPVKAQNEESMTSDSVKNAADPQVVRLEALQKLGLLKDQETENETVAPLPPPTSQTSLGPTSNRTTRGPSTCNPWRSPSFCYSQVPTEPKNRPLQSSASFHHSSRRDQQPTSHPVQPNGLKTPGLERSVTFDNHIHTSEPQHVPSANSKTNWSPPKPEPHKASNMVGYTVMVVPGMGADRKEALRKLGLLKD